MIRSASYTGQFKRDVKLAEKRGKDMGKLRFVISMLLDGKYSRASLPTTSLKAKGSQAVTFI